MIFFKYVFFLFFFIINLSLVAQDRIRFLDGKELECKIEGHTDTTVWVTKVKGKKTREAIFSNQVVFSVVYKDSIEVVLYIPNKNDEKPFSVEQMRSYVEGASFARRNYNSITATSGAFIVGAGGGLIGFWGFLPALVYDLGISSYQVRPKSRKNEPLPAVVDDFFMFGYKDVAQKQKTHHVIVGSIVGFATGVAYTYIMLKE